MHIHSLDVFNSIKANFNRIYLAPHSFEFDLRLRVNARSLKVTRRYRSRCLPLSPFSNPWIFMNVDCVGLHVKSHMCCTKFDKHDGHRFRKFAANFIFVLRVLICGKKLTFCLVDCINANFISRTIFFSLKRKPARQAHSDGAFKRCDKLTFRSIAN